MTTKRLTPADKQKQTIRRACAEFNYKWPKQLTSGVMFFDGQRITIEEFVEQARLFTDGDCK